MNVLLDVHADRYWLQSAVTCNIASSHVYLHALMLPRSASRRMNLCLEFQQAVLLLLLPNKIFQQLSVTELQNFPSTNFEYG